MAFREGRLDVVEYDQRCREIVESVYEEDLAEVFIDIPRRVEKSPGSPGSPGSPASPASVSSSRAPERVYTESEVQRAHVSGARKRFGTMCLISLASVLLGLLSEEALFLAAIPAALVGLYVLRWGPQSWNVMSAREVERRERRELKAAERRQALERRVARREVRAEITDSAMRWASGALNRKNQP